MKSLLNEKPAAGVEQLMVPEQQLALLEPISTLSKQHQSQLFKSAEVLECTNGHHVFEQGQEDKLDFYLMDGAIDLYDGSRRVKQITASKSALVLLDPRLPRQYTAQATSHAVIVVLPRGLLNNLTELVGRAQAAPDVEVDDIDSAETNNWMIRMLRSRAFANVPTANLHKLFLKMDSIPMKRGEMVVQQGEPGDYFFVVQAGACAVCRKPRENAPEIKLADLGPGDSFGEEALIAGKVRNASVRMATDGRVMRLGKNDFLELVKEALVREVDSRQANAMIEHGARWIDIRSKADFQRGSIPDSLNLELAFLREEAHNLARDGTYVICSDSPTQSACGAFLLAAQGLDVCSLDIPINEYLLQQGFDVAEPEPAPPETPSGASNSADAPQPPAPGAAAEDAAPGVAGPIDAQQLKRITREIEERLRGEMEAALQAERKRWEVELRARMEEYKTALKSRMEKQMKAAYRRKLEEKLAPKNDPDQHKRTGDSRTP